jgi:cytochrome c
MTLKATLAVAALFALTNSTAWATHSAAHNASVRPTRLAPGLTIPAMDPERGKRLFASKGCVVCHSVNGVGGTDAPHLDAATMPSAMSPFDFFAKMWRGAIPMIMMQQDEIGHQIEFTGQDLADIVAFVHNAEVQASFSEDDIPPDITAHMEEDSDGDSHHGMMDGAGTMQGSGMMGGGGMMGQPPKQ